MFLQNWSSSYWILGRLYTEPGVDQPRINDELYDRLHEHYPDGLELLIRTEDGVYMAPDADDRVPRNRVLVDEETAESIRTARLPDEVTYFVTKPGSINKLTSTIERDPTNV